jgi:hypothetical protein
MSAKLPGQFSTDLFFSINVKKRRLNGCFDQDDEMEVKKVSLGHTIVKRRSVRPPFSGNEKCAWENRR